MRPVFKLVCQHQHDFSPHHNSPAQPSHELDSPMLTSTIESIKELGGTFWPQFVIIFNGINYFLSSSPLPSQVPLGLYVFVHLWLVHSVRNVNTVTRYPGDHVLTIKYCNTNWLFKFEKSNGPLLVGPHHPSWLMKSLRLIFWEQKHTPWAKFWHWCGFQSPI